MREGLLKFLENTEWAYAKITPVAGDLSARNYVRLSLGGATAIVMDSSNERSSLPAFVRMTHWLRDIGLSAPRLLKDSQTEGFLLLEDLGEHSVSQRLSRPTETRATLDACLNLLLTIRHAAAPKLSTPKVKELCDWTTLADDYYPGANKHELDSLRAFLETILARHATKQPTVSLRDFHADNLMWLPEKLGVAKLGLLDYQDAMLTHPVYDLVSLLTDARTSISPDLRADYVKEYSRASGDDLSHLKEAFSAVSIQRNLRILGIFHRASVEHGKHHHLPKIPRVYGYLKEALEHPTFAKLAPQLRIALPPPEGLV